MRTHVIMGHSAISDDAFKPPKEFEEAWNRHPGIVKLGSPVLREIAKPVTQIKGETRQLVDRMIATMKEAHGLGLAAPQVGVSTRIIVYDAGEGVRVLINPTILASDGEQVDPPEGCLSIPGLQGQVKRAMNIRVKGYDRHGKPVMRKVKELEARVIQHEIDHLNGILFIERADPDTLEWVISNDDDDEDAGLRE